MKRRNRYLLLVIGCVIFLILAPLMVLYVQGINYDSTTREFYRTGILAIRTFPKNAEVFLNGVKKSSASGDLKFIKPGEYTIVIKKDGYFPWSKRLLVKANEVTWVTPTAGILYLYKKDAPIITLATEVTDVILNNSQILYLSGNTLYITAQGTSAQTDHYPLAKNVSNIILSPDRRFALLQNNATETIPVLYLFNLKTKQLQDISSLVTGHSNIQFAGDGSMYILENKNLFVADTQNVKKTLLVPNINAYTILGTTLYYTQTTSGGLTNLVSKPVNGGDPQILLTTPITLTNANIYIDFQKEIFLLGDGSLYRITSTLEKIADGITDVNFNASTGNLILVRGGELDYYNFYKQSLDFITRTGLPLKNPFVRPDLGTAFVLRNNQLLGLELDTRDNQNEYPFYQGVAPKKFMLDENAKNIFILDEGVLKVITIQ